MASHEPMSFGGRQGKDSGPQKQNVSSVVMHVHTPVGSGVAKSLVDVDEVQIVVLNGVTSVKTCSHCCMGQQMSHQCASFACS